MFALSRRRLVGLVGCLVTATALVSGCSTGADGESGDSGAPGGNADRQQQTLIERAPVASKEALESSPAAQAIRERGVLLNGTEVGMPLLSQRNPATGQVTGFDATIAKMLAKYITGEPNVKQVTATGHTRESMLQVGTVDVIVHAYTMTKKRAQKVSFAGPYLVSGAAIAVLKDSTGITSLDDLAGKTVCAIEDSSHIQAIKEQAPASTEIDTAKTAPQCVQALESGDAEAYVHDRTILAGAAALNKKIKVVGEPFTDEPYGIGVSNQDTAFKKFINDWLGKIEQSGLWKDAWKRSLGEVVSEPPSPPEIGTAPIG